ncbi:MAG: VOC family protein [Proteobacteria bacterium]|nr:VOC family protein [Pseudomonadota bacterium]
MSHPLKSITPFQLGLVVKDIDAAVKEHSEVYGIKRWYRTNIDRFDYYYKGKKRLLVLDIVVGYTGGTQIELIQVLEGEDNAYVELLLKENLPHNGVCVRNFERKFEQLKALGYPELHHGTIYLKGLSKIRVAYFDTRESLGYILEIIEVKTLGINIGMPEFMVAAARLTGDSKRYKPIHH